MSLNLSFSVCRVCFVPDCVSTLSSLFVEDGENAEKFQSVSGINILDDRGKYDALICGCCLNELNIAYRLRFRMRNAEENVFAKQREEFLGVQATNKGVVVEAAEKSPAGDTVMNAEIEVTVPKQSEKKSLSLKDQRKDFQLRELQVIIIPIELQPKNTETENKINEIQPSQSLKNPALDDENSRVKREESVEFEIQIDDEVIEDKEDTNFDISEMKLHPSGDESSKEKSQNIVEEHGSSRVTRQQRSKQLEQNGEAMQQNKSKKDDAHLANSLEPRKKKNVSNIIKKKKPWKCTICSKITTTKSGLRQHIENVHEKKKRFTCAHCPKGFYYRGELIEHLFNRHAFTNDNTTNPNRPFKCDFEGCWKFFKTKKALKHHQLVHSDPRPFVCHCGSSHKMRKHLVCHQKNLHEKV